MEADNSKIYDVHIHFGEFRDRFFAPEVIDSILRACGVNGYSAMLFPNKLPLNIERDFWINSKLSEQNKNADLILVVSPELLKQDKDLCVLGTLPYKMIKLHGALHNWHPNGKSIRDVFKIAQSKNIPIMLHTGGGEKSDAGTYLNICLEFPNVKVILAHSRPFEETIKIMNMCPNVWADTSFLPIEKIISFDKEGLNDRVLFGTDFPIAPFFSNEANIQTWYKKNISQMVSELGLTMFKTISNVNYTNFYC
jgi:predicted TIM-barrel fold metal-dependent hydrolase